MKYLQHPSLSILEASFPTTGDYHNGPRKGQQRIMEFVAENGSSTIEAGTGTGKTGSQYGVLCGAEQCMPGPFFWIVPNKTILRQHQQQFSGVTVALGRNEHPCLYYAGNQKTFTSEELEGLCSPGSKCPRADEVPCSMLKNCPHRVNQTTGETVGEGFTPCPYLQQKYEASQGGIVLCTMAFYLFTRLFSKEEVTGALVIDEAHRMADVVRRCLSYEITDYQIEQSIALLERIEASEAAILLEFLEKMREVITPRTAPEGELIGADDIGAFIKILNKIDNDRLLKKIEIAVDNGHIDPVDDRKILLRLEMLVRNLRRYVHSLEYSLEQDGHRELNYTCAFRRREMGESDRVECKLVIKCYYVAPLIRKILPSFTVAYSATIGDEDTFAFETGIRFPVLSLPTPFPVANTRLYLPDDTPNLAVAARGRNDVGRVLRRIAKACVSLGEKGHRSLVVVISNVERQRFLEIAREVGLNVVSYGNGVTAREAAINFRDGEGTTLIGTSANYAEGVDLPKQSAPVIFFLRPGYPSPSDPGTKFEEQRFGRQRWALWNWRVMQQVMQVRGRNVRGHRDMGVTILISQQFRRFAFASLPQELQGAYKTGLSFDACIRDAEKLLQG